MVETILFNEPKKIEDLENMECRACQDERYLSYIETLSQKLFEYPAEEIEIEKNPIKLSNNPVEFANDILTDDNSLLRAWFAGELGILGCDNHKTWVTTAEALIDSLQDVVNRFKDESISYYSAHYGEKYFLRGWSAEFSEFVFEKSFNSLADMMDFIYRSANIKTKTIKFLPNTL